MTEDTSDLLLHLPVQWGRGEDGWWHRLSFDLGRYPDWQLTGTICRRQPPLPFVEPGERRADPPTGADVCPDCVAAPQ
jgi:hypothetical protein